MEQVTIVGLNLAKRVFQVHGATADGGIAIRKKAVSGPGVGIFHGPAALCSGDGGLCYSTLLGP